MIGDELNKYDFRQNMSILMANTSDEVDKRQGGLFYDIYTAVANFGVLVFTYLKSIVKGCHPSTAQGEDLDLCAEDEGLKRIEATNAIKRVLIFDKEGNAFDVDLGTLVTPRGNGTLLYSLIEKEDVGRYKARCTETGVVGNPYTGACEILLNGSNVGQVLMTDLIESARDEENDSELRERIAESNNASNFGGNIQDYRSLVGVKLTTIKQMQVYPRDFTDPILNSTVLSVVDNDNEPLTDEALNELQEYLDPSTYPAQGRGILPVGHHPVVASPTEITVNVSMEVQTKTGYDLDNLKSAIRETVEEYFEETRNHWWDIDYDAENLYTVELYTAQIIARVANIEGILRVDNVKFNDVADNLALTETKALQEIPVLGEIIYE